MKTINKSYQLTIACELLFDAWISPEMTIPPVTKIACDPKVGGELKLYAESAETVGIMTGVFEEVAQNEKLKYTWQWEGSDEITIVTVIFQAVGNQTIVQLEHSGFLSKESYEAHDSGWDNYVDGLVSRLDKS